ncbi:hypothetical protein NDU88_004069 [Pleurodeles waltl]|uniref:Uncharacterized protein n=1 Tax=Pleurodeles waltl TaxID=8319 RepID=A0AAV7V471_PLEWA|nr:hypothetical protein NDU88_004069 [Pleurodeles waltl]
MPPTRVSPVASGTPPPSPSVPHFSSRGWLPHYGLRRTSGARTHGLLASAPQFTSGAPCTPRGLSIGGGVDWPPQPHKVRWHPSPGPSSRPPNVWPGPAVAPTRPGDHSTNAGEPLTSAPPAAPVPGCRAGSAVTPLRPRSFQPQGSGRTTQRRPLSDCGKGPTQASPAAAEDQPAPPAAAHGGQGTSLHLRRNCAARIRRRFTPRMPPQA